MKVVLWFVVILINGVFAEINHQNEFSATGSNLTSYTNEDYPPTGKLHAATSNRHQNESTWSQSSTTRTEIDALSNITEDIGSKNSDNNKLKQDTFAKNENSDALLKKDNVIDQGGVYTNINNIFSKEFSTNSDETSSSSLSDTTEVFSSSTQKNQSSIFENTLATMDLSNLPSTDSSSNPTLNDTLVNDGEIEHPDGDMREFSEDVDPSSANMDDLSTLVNDGENENPYGERSEFSEDGDPLSTYMDDLSTSPLSEITNISKNLREEKEMMTSTFLDPLTSDDVISSPLLDTTTGTESSSQESTTEKETSFYSSTNSKGISSTDRINSMVVPSPDYTYTPPVSSIDTVTTSEENAILTRACEIPDVNFSHIYPYGFNVTLEWETPDSSCSYIEYVIYLDNEEVNRTQDLTLTIEDLYACNEYTVSIAAADGNSTGNKSEAKSFRTTVPTSFVSYGVQNLTVIKTPEDSLEVRWEPPVEEVRRCVTNYFLTWWDEDNSNPIDSVNTTETSHTLPLIGCMQYAFLLYPQSGASNNGHEEQANYTADPIPFYNMTVKALPRKTDANITWQIDNTKNRCQLEEIFVTCNALPDQNFNASWINGSAEAHQSFTEQNENYTYTITIDELSPFTNYTCIGVTTNAAGNSTERLFEVRTVEDVPSQPVNLTIVDVGPTSFTINWEEPEMIPGIMTLYGLKINSGGPRENPTKECSNNVPSSHFDVSAANTNFTFQGAIPYYLYQVSIYGVDGAGNGTEATTEAFTASAEPDSVTNAQIGPPTYSQNETYYATVNVTFDTPCSTNGPFKYYAVSYNGVRYGFSNDNKTIPTNASVAQVVLLPARTYSFSVTVVTENFTSPAVSTTPIQSQAGVPIFTGNVTPPTTNDDTKAYFTLSKSAFSNENGEIIAYSLILMTTSTQNSSYGFWEGTNETWPSLPEKGIQLTPNFWNPFNGGAESVNCIIGADGGCSGQTICNQTLNEGTKYWIMVRALTSAGYKDSSLLYFETEMLASLDLALILGLTFGLLLLLTLIGFLLFLWRRRRRNAIPEEEKRPSTNTSPTPIPVQKFVSYYASIKEDYNIVRQQFIDLGPQSKEFAGEISFAILPENKRKNRYTNILPFDATRVSLNIDEDDEISSDYINASYIKGYTDRVEYIATQGPLEQTARDFWKMILQENVTIIAMVSQFVEQSKEKCFHYFPNNHESVYFGESLEVKCSTELHFGTYCVRTLQVRKNSEQRDVVHMQFLEWPDFGVPQGTDNMLQFCGQLREKVNKEGGLIAVHCSAGVGRTGTLIALDILLQTIDDHRDINIYKTVFDLRKQRTNMVQTEKQYMFLYTCIKEYIETPSTQTNDVGGDRIYENMDVLRSSLKKNLIESEIESAL